jgi:methyl coenzyme M reductase gamma subunit
MCPRQRGANPGLARALTEALRRAANTASASGSTNLAVVELDVEALARQQLVVGALLHDPAVVHARRGAAAGGSCRMNRPRNQPPNATAR